MQRAKVWEGWSKFKDDGFNIWDNKINPSLSPLLRGLIDDEK